MKAKIFVFGLACLYVQLAYAEPSCKIPTSYAEIISCAELNSPETQRAEAELKRARAQADAASQFVNPDLDVESLSGKDDQGRVSETDLSLKVPFELGGKRSARKAIAKGELVEAEAKAYAARANVRSQVYLSLHRLRQLIEERKIIDESVTTFEKLVRAYQNRPVRSPEQEVTLSVFRITHSDFELRKSVSEAEFATIQNFFKTVTGLSLPEIQKVLPKAPTIWPKISEGSGVQSSLRLKTLAAELEIANAKLESAKADSWPTLSVGPAIKMNREAGQSFDMVGASASMPLPIFSLNRGARSAAAAAKSGAEINRRLAIDEETNRREQLVRSYNESVTAFSKILSVQDLEKKHAGIEKHFLRGTVPSSLIIESHRSLLDLEESRNKRQLETLEILLQLYALDGTILEQKL